MGLRWGRATISSGLGNTAPSYESDRLGWLPKSPSTSPYHLGKILSRVVIELPAIHGSSFFVLGLDKRRLREGVVSQRLDLTEEVRISLVKSASFPFSSLSSLSNFSCTRDEERRTCLTTPSIRVAKEYP
jgi:hypothetical protein